MKTAQLDSEIFNHYAAETKMYLADYPTVFQQKRYLQHFNKNAIFNKAHTLNC